VEEEKEDTLQIEFDILPTLSREWWRRRGVKWGARGTNEGMTGMKISVGTKIEIGIVTGIGIGSRTETEAGIGIVTGTGNNKVHADKWRLWSRSVRGP
jgi:hypothetical protein